MAFYVPSVHFETSLEMEQWHLTLCDLHLCSALLPWEVIKSVVLSKGLLEEFEKSKIIANGDTWLSWYCMAARLQSLCYT